MPPAPLPTSRGPPQIPSTQEIWNQALPAPFAHSCVKRQYGPPPAALRPPPPNRPSRSMCESESTRIRVQVYEREVICDEFTFSPSTRTIMSPFSSIAATLGESENGSERGEEANKERQISVPLKKRKISDSNSSGSLCVTKQKGDHNYSKQLCSHLSSTTSASSEPSPPPPTTEPLPSPRSESTSKPQKLKVRFSGDLEKEGRSEDSIKDRLTLFIGPKITTRLSLAKRLTAKNSVSAKKVAKLPIGRLIREKRHEAKLSRMEKKCENKKYFTRSSVFKKCNVAPPSARRKSKDTIVSSVEDQPERKRKGKGKNSLKGAQIASAGRAKKYENKRGCENILNYIDAKRNAVHSKPLLQKTTKTAWILSQKTSSISFSQTTKSKYGETSRKVKNCEKTLTKSRHCVLFPRKKQAEEFELDLDDKNVCETEFELNLESDIEFEVDHDLVKRNEASFDYSCDDFESR